MIGVMDEFRRTISGRVTTVCLPVAKGGSMRSAEDRKRQGSANSLEVLETIRAGFERRDAALLASVYAEDAEYTIVNRNNPPSRPLVLRGRSAVRAMFEDICAREMTHRMVHTVVGDETLAYSNACQYPDGCRVAALNLATLRSGKIASEFSIDCWDE